MTNTTITGWPNAEQFEHEIRDAKRAPEIAAWLRLGPLPLRKIIKFRRRRIIQSGASRDVADWYAPASVAWDLARVAGMGGVVVLDGDQLRLREDKRHLIDDWVKRDAERAFARMRFDD